MANEDDVRGTKSARAELGRRGIDSSRADIRVMHGICYIRGQLSAVRSANIPDLKAEVEKIAKILRTKAEIKDVVIDAIFRS